MGKSRNELKKSLILFNSRASTTWSKDESKFGQRMLEKMGWKKGEGLGAQHQGITENIKLRLKLDAKGLGFKENDDQWLKVEHGFSSVLSKLKEQVDVKLENVNSNETKSLESKSSTSKSRVHYSKYTRGKDVSRYNEEDLIGILGQSRKRRLEDDTETDEPCIIDGIAGKPDHKSSRRKSNFSATEVVLIEDNDYEKAITEETKCSRLENSLSAVSSENTEDECQMESARKKSEDRKKKRKKTYSSLDNESIVEHLDDNSADDELPKRELCSGSSEFVSTKKNIKEIRNDEPLDTSLNVSLEDAADEAISPRRARKKSVGKKKNRKDAESFMSPKENDCEEIDNNELPNSPSAVFFKNDINNASSSECERRSRKKSKDRTRKREKKSSEQESNFNTTEFVPLERNNTNRIIEGEVESVNPSLASSNAPFFDESKKSEDTRKNDIETSVLFENDSSLFVPRKPTRAEHIVEKSRLRREMLNGERYHEFIGSNTTEISGYEIDSFQGVLNSFLEKTLGKRHSRRMQLN